MFKRISIILLILFTLLAFTSAVDSAGVYMIKASDDSYIRWVDSEDSVILEINEDGTTTLGGTVDYSQTILMETTDEVQFWDTGLSIGATANGALAIGSDGTLVTTVTTSSTLYTPTYVHGYDASNKVTTTVSSTGTVLVATTGASTGSYEIQTDDALITLDAATGIVLDSGSGVTTLTGDLNGSDAAGPAIIDEAAAHNNPTLVPNKAEETSGIGWVSSGIINIAIGGTREFEFSATGIDMNSNALTEMGTYGGTGKVTLTPGAAGTFLDFDLNAAWLGGTLINADFSASTTPTQAIIGVALDLGTNVVVTAEEDVKAIDINLPQMTVSADTKTVKGIEITTTGAFVWSSSGTGTFTGVDVTIPAITEGASTTMLATGLKVTGQAITTNGDVYGLLLAGVFTTGVQIGLDGGELDLVLYTDRGISVYNSTDATGGTVMSMYVEMISTAACKARAAEFVLAPTAQLGQWANAVKTYLNLLGASGGTGTVSSLCVEVLFPDEQQTSSVTVLELEAVVNTGYVYSPYTSVILFQLSGTDSSSFQTGAYFLYVGGLTSATGDMWYGNTLKCLIIGTEWFLPFSSAEDSYTTIYPVDITVSAGTALDIGTSVIGIDFTGTYTTGAIRIGQSGASAIELAAYGDFNIASYTACAATSGTQKHNIFQGIMDGAGALGRVVYVELTVDDVAAGSYVNAFKAQIQFDATGAVVGIASAACLEMVLTTGAQVGGTYAALEIEMVCPATWAPSGALYTMIYMGVSGNTATTYDVHGTLFYLAGVTSGTTDFFYENTIKCKVNSTYFYLPLSSAEGSYTTDRPIVSSLASGAAIDITGPATGIDIGASTAVGINMTGGGVIGIDFNGAWTGNVIQIGDSTTALTTATTGLKGLYIHYEYTKTTGNISGVYSKLDIDYDSTGYVTSQAVYGVVMQDSDHTGGAAYPAGVRGQMHFATDADIDNSSSVFAGVVAVLTSAGTPTFTSGKICALYVDNLCEDDLSGANVNSSMIHIANNDAGTSGIKNVVYLYAPYMTYFVNFDAACVNGNELIQATSAGAGTQSHRIQCKFGETEFWIYGYTD